METRKTSDIWIARNLGFIAALQVLMGFVGPFVFGLMAIVYPLIQLRHWSFHSAREAVFSLLAAVLVLLAPLLLVQYWRYPRLALGMRQGLFWWCSVVYVPAWILVFAFSGEQPMIAWRDLREFGGIISVGALLPAVHFLLSIGGLIASRGRTKNVEPTPFPPLNQRHL